MLHACPCCQSLKALRRLTPWQARHSQRMRWCSGRAQAGRVRLQVTIGAVQIDFLGEPTTGNLHLVQREGARGVSGVHALGLRHTGDVFDAPLEQLRANQQVLAALQAKNSNPVFHACKLINRRMQGMTCFCAGGASRCSLNRQADFNFSRKSRPHTT